MNTTTGPEAEAEMKRMEKDSKKKSKLDRLSPDQLRKLEKLIAAEKPRRRGKRPSEMSDTEFAEWTGLAVAKQEKADD